MTGDFSRDTFDRRHHFSRVLEQQGRVALDADGNEQTSIILHYLRAIAADMIGPHGGPGAGFEIACNPDLRCDFGIGYGHYYVDGILCENDALDATYQRQPDFPLGQDEARLEHDTAYLVYLHVWERYLAYPQAPHIREVALGGPDTAGRAKVVWQVEVVEESEDCATREPAATCSELLDELVDDRHGCLRARARVDVASEDPCVIRPDARYRGPENQLYRVEIHDDSRCDRGASFMWSRDNGSVVFGIRSLQGNTVVLDALGPDERRTLAYGDWVEIVDDFSALRFRPRRLLRVAAVDAVTATVILTVPEGAELPTFDENSDTHPLLRRWDQDSDGLEVVEEDWIELEDGVEIYFDPGGTYQTGDFWLIPARTATGDVWWPSRPAGGGGVEPVPVPPHGITHHYAPLARIEVNDNGSVTWREDCRCTFEPLCSPVDHGPAEKHGAAERSGPPGDRQAQIDRLMQIRDVGHTRAEVLWAAGHHTPEAVAALSVAQIQNLLAVTEKAATIIRESAVAI